MKRALLILSAAVLLFAGCTSVKTSSSGVDNEAYLEFLGDPHLYTGDVKVDIDGTVFFTVQVEDPATVNRLRGMVYSIKPGTHVVTVTYDGVVLYKQKILISNQETRKIKL